MGIFLPFCPYSVFFYHEINLIRFLGPPVIARVCTGKVSSIAANTFRSVWSTFIPTTPHIAIRPSSQTAALTCPPLLRYDRPIPPTWDRFYWFWLCDRASSSHKLDIFAHRSSRKLQGMCHTGRGRDAMRRDELKGYCSNE